MKHLGLKFKLMKPTLLFYTVAATVVFILGQVSPGGPCTPGLGVLAFFALLVVAVILLLRNIYLVVKVDKGNMINIGLHIIAILLLIVTMQ